MKGKYSSKNKLRALCEGAVFVALAQILSYVKLYEMPYGGSICFCMLPIFFYCVRWGFGPGMLASFVFSCLLAYTVLGAAGLFHGKKYGLFWGSAVGSLARFLVNYVVGATVWAEYMPDTFFNMTMTTPWFYSAIYNGFYVGLSLVLCLVVEALLYKPLGRYINGEDLA